MLFLEVTTVYSENYELPVNTLCGQGAELLKIRACVAHKYHIALKI
jgi:hypothetical protein